MKAWFNKYKVIIFGLLAAIALPINDLITQGGVSTKAIVFAGVTAALTFAARNLRGQWATIAGLLGTTATYYLTMDTSGNVDWSKIIMFFIVQILAIVAPPAKSVGYERTDTIMEAKQEGEEIKPSIAPPKP
jgi:hypothetical protein